MCEAHVARASDQRAERIHQWRLRQALPRKATLERGASELVGRDERRTPAADDGYLRR